MEGEGDRGEGNRTRHISSVIKSVPLIKHRAFASYAESLIKGRNPWRRWYVKAALQRRALFPGTYGELEDAIVGIAAVVHRKSPGGRH